MPSNYQAILNELRQTGRKALGYLQMEGNSDEHSYSFDADYPQVDSEDSSAAETNLSISAFVSRVLQRFRAEAAARSAEKCELRKADLGSSAWDSLSIAHKVWLFTPSVLSIEFQLRSYQAIAIHPNTNTRTLNLQLHPSRELELQDIFIPSSNYLQLLSDYCVADLHNQQPQRFHDPAQRSEQLKKQPDQWILSGAAHTHSNYARFVLVEGGIRVFFDPYQVGSYAEGRYEVFVLALVLAPALKPTVVGLLGLVISSVITGTGKDR
jgi:hypothetical protein